MARQAPYAKVWRYIGNCTFPTPLSSPTFCPPNPLPRNLIKETEPVAFLFKTNLLWSIFFFAPTMPNNRSAVSLTERSYSILHFCLNKDYYFQDHHAECVDGLAWRVGGENRTRISVRLKHSRIYSREMQSTLTEFASFMDLILYRPVTTILSSPNSRKGPIQYLLY